MANAVFRSIKKCFIFIIILATIGIFFNFLQSSTIHRVTQVKLDNNSQPDAKLFSQFRQEGWSPAYDYPHIVRTIPKILHQTWDTYNVPVDFKKWILTWIEHNPDWEYWFWSEDDVRQLLQIRYPKYLTTYENYKLHLSRADAMRYFIMDSIGGYYADLDVHCLRPLNNWTYDPNGCILTEETYSHSFVLHHHTKPNVMTTILGCKPGHPFYKEVLCGLPIALEAEAVDTMYNTGPWFLDTMYNKFLQYTNVTNQIQNMENRITILDPKYLLPTFDAGAGVASQCQRILRGKNIPPSLMRTSNMYLTKARHICEELQKKRYVNKPLPSSYTDHHWVHVITNLKAWSQKNTFSIFDLIPNTKTFRNITRGSQSSEYYKSGTLGNDVIDACQIKLSINDFKKKTV